jgi:hypothetical protein
VTYGEVKYLTYVTEGKPMERSRKARLGVGSLGVMGGIPEAS